MKKVLEIAKLEQDLTPLIEGVRAIPLSEWTYRNDRESDKTCTIVSSSKHSQLAYDSFCNFSSWSKRCV